MKIKIMLSILAFGITLSAFCQMPTMELTFTAENGGQYVPLDSILIENLTQGCDTTLYAPDTVLALGYNTSIHNNETIETNSISISQNYPNPFYGKTKVNLYLPKKDDIKITVRDILGSEMAHYESTLNRANHVFSIYTGSQKFYLLTVTGKQVSRTIKMLNEDCKLICGEKCKIVYDGFESNEIGLKPQKSTCNFRFNLDDELKFTGFTDVEETEMVQTPVGSQTYTFEFEGWTPCSGIAVVSDISGNTYNTVQIGTQCWMKENLKTTSYSNGTAIPNVTDPDEWSNLTSGAYVFYENHLYLKDSYGALYNWYTTVDPSGLCPTGWHVPTNLEWNTLIEYIGGYSSPHGNELKSCRQVNSPLGEGCNTSELPRWDESNTDYGTNDYGFSSLPGGNRVYDGYFNVIGNIGLWWSCSDYLSDYNAWFIILGCNFGHVGTDADDKRGGFSVRCLRDN